MATQRALSEVMFFPYFYYTRHRVQKWIVALVRAATVDEIAGVLIITHTLTVMTGSGGTVSYRES